MKKLFFLPLIVIVVVLTTQKVEAKIWTKDLVDKVTLDSGYKFSLCKVDMKYDVEAAKNAGFLTVPEKDFEANLDSYTCNKNSQEDILFANITLYFSKTNWGGGTVYAKIIQFQNKLYSVDNHGSIFNPDFIDSKKAYTDLGGVDWFSDTPGLHGIRGGNLIETDPSAKGAFLPNSTFIVMHDPATGKFTSAIFVFNNVVYKLSRVISKVSTETTLVDYTQPQNDNISPFPTIFPTVLSPTSGQIVTPTLTPVPQRIPSPPQISITYPSDGQSITMNNQQTFCVVDTPAGGNTSALQRKQNINGSGWTAYQSLTTLCYSPISGQNTLQLQYKNQYGDESSIYTRQFTFNRIQDITVSLSGILYKDINCNGTQDSGEGPIDAQATVNIFKIPEFYILATVISDSNGNFTYSKTITESDSLSVDPGPVAPSGYTGNPRYNSPTITLNTNNRNATVTMPEVPVANFSACQ